MELLPIIYNSLLIAAGLFVITIAISYVSFKFKKGKEEVKSEVAPSYTPIFKDKKRVEEELKPHHKTKNIKPSSQEKQSTQDFRKLKTPRKDEPKKERRVEPKKEIKQKPTERIERVRDLNANEKSQIEKNVKPFEKKKNVTEETRKKKNLKSIDDDPLKRYTDSADDELHPLKTED